MLIVVAGMLMIGGALLGPEPRHAELHRRDLGLARSAAVAPSAD